jgi:WD40 repeat protein
VLLHTLCDHASSINYLILLSNGHLASCCHDSTVNVWNVEMGGQLLRTFSLGAIIPRFCFIALPNEQIALVKEIEQFPYSTETISIFNSNTGELVKLLNGHADTVKSLVLLDEFNMASSSEDYTIKIWNLTRGGEMV